MLALVDTPRDTALLRYLVGHEYLKTGATEEAIEHLRVSVNKYPNDAAAWRMLGSALSMARRRDEALVCYRRGLSVAEVKGDSLAANDIRRAALRMGGEARMPPGQLDWLDCNFKHVVASMSEQFVGRDDGAPP